MKRIATEDGHAVGSRSLWEPSELTSVVTPTDVLSIRQFLALRLNWPEDAPRQRW